MSTPAGEVRKVLQSPVGRTTEADRENDRRSLDRKLSRTLYLVVKRNRKDAAWKFPQSDVVDKEENLRDVWNIPSSYGGRGGANVWCVGVGCDQNPRGVMWRQYEHLVRR